LLIAYS